MWGLNKRLRFCVGLGALPENKFCLGGRYAVHPGGGKKEINDLCHFFTHFILGKWIIFQEMEGVLAKAKTGIL